MRRTKCAYCQRRIGKFTCGVMLSQHCMKCCLGTCGGKRHFIDESMVSAKFMAGACWPSAYATRWALEDVLLKVHGYLQKNGVSKKLLTEFVDVTGLFSANVKNHGYKVKEKRA